MEMKVPQEVLVLKGGWHAWEDAGYPTEPK
jgi:3-mercaptopyruvate sulfurtransferase SseA